MNTEDTWSAATVLYSHGLTAMPHSNTSLIIEDDEREIVAEVKRLLRAPRAKQIESLRSKHPDRVQLYVVPSITPSAIKLGVQFPFIAFLGIFDEGLVWKSDHFSKNKKSLNNKISGKHSWVRLALMRTLLAPVKPMNQTQLANVIGTSQASISNALKTLQGHVINEKRGWKAVNPEKLWDDFLITYPGVGVTRTHWLSLDPPVKQSKDIANFVQEQNLNAKILYSGDMGADMVASWRVPTRSVIYSSHAINPESIGFVAATNSEATLDFVIPEDPTIWKTAKIFSKPQITGVSSADPLIIASELKNNPAVDIDEAISRLKAFTLHKLSEHQNDHR